jgi:phosphotransferase system  glucose/maltose/N-acetylglucosamine-specific IIC component
MLLDFALIGMAFLFAIPAVTGYFAYSHGRSFWLWFTIGCFLPIIANFIIAFLCRKEAIKAQKRKLSDLSRYEDEEMEKQVKGLVGVVLPDKKKVE